MPRILLLALIVLFTGPARAEGPGKSLYDFSFTSIEGEQLDLGDFRGQPLLLVNTASLCGFTYQYEGLQSLWEEYRDRGLVVLAVPSGDFGNQELGSEEEIKSFCEVTFGLDFPMTTKEHVKGPKAHPLYRWIAESLSRNQEPRWNFHKFLFDRSGQPLAGYPSSVEPGAEALIEAIEEALAAPPPLAGS